MQIGRVTAISSSLLSWYSAAKRELPWRITGNPYHIWLSEIILQQTRVNQGLPYFEQFVSHYPTVQALALAPEQEVLRLWQGLGYYSRARNLHKAAKVVHDKFDDAFPDNYDELLTLPGVGPYTAAAIASIGFGEAVPVLDGNVYRVVSRLYKIDKDISQPATRKVFMSVLEKLIPGDRPGDFNQGLMELGALICSPQNPKCDICPLSLFCEARASQSQTMFPVKKKKVKVRDRHFHYVSFRYDGLYGLQERVEKDIWQGLFQFLLMEEEVFSIDDFIADNELQVEITSVSESYKHILTHQRIEATFYELHFDKEAKFHSALRKHALKSYTYEQMLNLPKPKLLVNYLDSF